MAELGNRLAGERALVTGATSGIGCQIAAAFAQQGAHVVVAGRDAERGAEVIEAIERANGTAHFVQCDLNVATAAHDLIARSVVLLGGLSILVNNASGGGVGDGALLDITDDAWHNALHLNVTVPMQLCRAALPHMVTAQRGSIINISSRQAERASRGFAGYVASKSALNGLTRSIAVDYADHNIRCNTISPGYVINTRRDADLDDQRRARLEAMHLTRLGTADDVAHAAVYLASQESAFLTGINLQLDGGSSIARATSLG